MNSANTLSPPNMLSSMKIIIALELERTFASRQGLIYILAFAFFWYFLLKYAVFNETLMMMNQVVGADGVADKLFANYFKVAMYFFPLLCLFVAANQTGSDRERGTLRFMTLYCSRDVIFFARFLSQALIHYILILFSALTTLLYGLYGGDFSFQAISHSLIACANLAVIILPFIALMAVLSATVKSPRQATFYAGIIWSIASGIISLLSHYVPAADVLNMLVPGMQFSQLTSLNGSAMFSLAYIPLVQSALLLMLGREIMRRRSL